MGDRVGDGRRHRHHADLADALHAVRRLRIGVPEEDRADRRRVGGARERIVKIGRVDQAAALVEQLLAERRTEPHDDPADDLALDRGGVDRGPAVVRGDDIEDADLPGVPVHLHLHRVGGEGVGRRDVGDAGGEVHELRVDHGRLGHVERAAERRHQILDRDAGVAGHGVSAAQRHVLGRDAQLLGGERPEPARRGPRGRAHRCRPSPSRATTRTRGRRASPPCPS